MRVAVIGGSGFIGNRLADGLLEKGYEVVVVDIKEMEKKNIEMRIADVTNLEQTKTALKDVDIAYHLAGYVVERMRARPYEGTILHVDGTLNILEACRINHVKKILFASSFYVYDGINEKMTVNEETPLDILKMELFGATKLMGEALIKEYSQKYGLDYVIFRFGSTYGPGNCTSVVKTFIEFGLRGKPIEIWGKGRRRNQYTYVDDVVDGCILGINESNEIFNLISPEPTTTGQLAELLEKKYGFDVVYNMIQKEGPSMPYMSSKKAMERLGWNPVSTEEGIKKTISETINNAKRHSQALRCDR